MLCTSGTAAANFHPAVVEASHARVPLLVCTADRPPELRDTGAGQTIDQVHLFGARGALVLRSGPAHRRAGCRCRVARAREPRASPRRSGRPPGPVHLNLPFREPLLPTGAPLVDAPGRADGRPWTVSRHVATPHRGRGRRAAGRISCARTRAACSSPDGARGVTPATAQRFAAAAGWPVLADPISQLRAGPLAISTYEALLRAPGFADAHRPDLVVRVGAPLTSKIATAWLDPSIAQVLVDPTTAGSIRTTPRAERFAVDAESLLARGRRRAGRAEPARAWSADWLDGGARRARAAIDRDARRAAARLCEGAVARDVAAALPDGCDARRRVEPAGARARVVHGAA